MGQWRTIHTALFVSLCSIVLVSSAETATQLSQQEKNVGKLPLTDSVGFENDYARVLRNAAACTTAHPANFGTRIVVALTDVVLQSTKGTRHLTRGEVAVFPVNESYRLPTGEFFEVAIKTPHPPVKAPEEWVEPTKNTFVYEDEEIRVFEERLDPGDERPLHSHAQRIVVRLNNVQLTDPRTHPTDTPRGGMQVPNTVRFAEPIVHVVRNLSQIPLFNIVIEFKVPH